MDIALCYESVLPQRGGAEMYIADLARALSESGHSVHLYASRWDADALPRGTQYHALPLVSGPRFLRPWRFGAVCEEAVRRGGHQLSIGFNKTWGQDILYPLGGLHVASARQNARKHRQPAARLVARAIRGMDLAHWSYCRLERRQYLGADRPTVIVNSELVRRHFQKFYGIGPERIHVVHSAIHPGRMSEEDRPRRRFEWRAKWGIGDQEAVALFVAMNYRLKGLEPLLRAVRRVPRDRPFRLVVVGNPRTRPYERLAERLGVRERVHFAGFCAETRNCYFAADFLVHPTFYDPCSLVVLEALACGLPVITSRQNGASELMNPPHDGYVVADPHDEEHLGWCLEQLASNARRIACNQAVRRQALQWTFADHCRKLLQVFQETAGLRAAA